MSSPKLERLDYPIKELPSGDNLCLHAFRLRGTSPGPHVHIQASVHGAEVQGNAVIYELLQFFSKHPFKGSITFVPMANPLAVATKTGTYTQGRFNPQSGNNYNRNYIDLTSLHREICSFDIEDFCKKNSEYISQNDYKGLSKVFKEYLLGCLDEAKQAYSLRGLSEEKKLAFTLQKLAATADIVLDLHTGPEATRYLYAGEFCKEKVKDFPFPFTLLIPNEFAGAMDEATFTPWIKLSEYLTSNGHVGNFPFPFESYTVELGSEEVISFEKAKVDAQRILHLLSKRGIVEEDVLDENLLPSEPQFATHLEYYKSYYAPRGGLFEYIIKPGEHFKEGDVLGTFLSFKNLKELKDLDDCVQHLEATEPGIVINHNPSAVVSEGTTLFQVFTNTFKR